MYLTVLYLTVIYIHNTNLYYVFIQKMEIEQNNIVFYKISVYYIVLSPNQSVVIQIPAH